MLLSRRIKTALIVDLEVALSISLHIFRNESPVTRKHCLIYHNPFLNITVDKGHFI